MMNRFNTKTITGLIGEAVASLSSDENGVYNLYEVPTDGAREPTPLTHVMGGVFSSSFSPDGKTITAVAYDNRGYYLTLIPYNLQILAGEKLPRIHGTSKRKGREKREADAQTLTSETHTDLQPYSSYSNIQFDYWGPWLTASYDGIEGGVGAVFSDATGYQNLRLLAGMESEYETALWTAQYTYKGFYPAVHLYAGQDQEIYPDLVKEPDGSAQDCADYFLLSGNC